MDIKNFFGETKQKIKGKIWDWLNFKTTEGFPISDVLMDWVIGQDKALEECKLCIDEWVRKLLWLKRIKWWKGFENPEGEKSPPKDWLPAGPFLLLVGDAGTGKSLIGRALSSYMTKLYKTHNIELVDIVSWKNDSIPAEPRISIHPSSKGKELVRKKRIEALKKNRLVKWFFRLLTGVLFGFGLTVVLLLMGGIVWNWIANVAVDYGFTQIPIQTYYNGNFLRYLMGSFMSNAFMIYLGIGAMFSGGILFIFKNLLGGMTGNVQRGVGGAETIDSPKLIVDNSSNKAPFVDATGHGSAQLFGSIAWDPYQTGGLGTPEHQRVSAGDVHRAHLGVLYIDEIKNLTGPEAITLLTVLEDGQLPIALRSQWHGGDTAAMAVSTEPVPCMVFLVAAGNLDSIPMIHPALMDRIQGYGKTIHMNNDMPNTVENRRKYIQFIAQEIKRFNLLPFSREACIEMIEESRRKAGRSNRLTTKFRPMISIIKTASILAINEGKKIVGVEHIKKAIEEHCKTIYMQVLEHVIERSKEYLIINPEAEPMIGQIHSLGVMVEGNGEMIGNVGVVKASVVELRDDYMTRGKEGKSGYFNVSGVSEEQGSWVQHSILKIYHIIHQLYNFKHPIGVHIDFAQEIGVDGPSAGITMLLALISIIEERPIRQDVAVTGEINIGIEDKITVTPIGGVYEKIKAAERFGFKKVVIPKRNLEKNVKIEDFKIEIVGCETLDEYIREVLMPKRKTRKI